MHTALATCAKWRPSEEAPSKITQEPGTSIVATVKGGLTESPVNVEVNDFCMKRKSTMAF